MLPEIKIDRDSCYRTPPPVTTPAAALSSCLSSTPFYRLPMDPFIEDTHPAMHIENRAAFLEYQQTMGSRETAPDTNSHSGSDLSATSFTGRWNGSTTTPLDAQQHYMQPSINRPLYPSAPSTSFQHYNQNPMPHPPQDSVRSSMHICVPFVVLTCSLSGLHITSCCRQPCYCLATKYEQRKPPSFTEPNHPQVVP